MTMIRVPRYWLAITALGALWLAAPVDYAAAQAPEQPNRAESRAAKFLHNASGAETLAAIRETRGRRIQAQERLDSELERRARTTAELLDRVAATKERARRLEARREIARQGQQDEENAPAGQVTEATGDAVFAAARAAAEDALARVTAGVSYRRADRVAELEQIIDTLGDDAQPASQTLSALNAWWAFVGREFQSAGQVSVRNDTVVVDGGKRRLHANIFRLGHVTEFWVSEDGATVGSGPVGAGDVAPWALLLNADDRAGVESAVAVARRKAEPRFVAVPVPVATATTGSDIGVAAPALNEGGAP